MLCAFVTISCSDWDDHYDATSISTEEDVEIYSGDIVSYMKSTSDVSSISAVFQSAGIYDSVFTDREYTFIVVSNDVYGDGSSIEDKDAYAEYCVADLSISPSKLTDGFGIYTRSGKCVWVYDNDGTINLDEFNIEKKVKTDNGYVYYTDGILTIRQSIYEYLNSLGDEYSIFKSLVARYESLEFDEENSEIIGVTEDGSTLYDSVLVVENELMDRYDENGIEVWNMRDESYVSTMFIPTNSQITNALNAALDSIPFWLNRDTTEADRTKFEKWIVRACFVDSRLDEETVDPSASIFECVGGYQKTVDETADSTTYDEIDPAYWHPGVNTVDVSNKINLSNGVAYYVEDFKIPNHVIIYRVKSRLYQLWNNMTTSQQDQYFRWTHFQDPGVLYDAQGEYELSETLPTIYYHVLTAFPDDEAIADSLHCSVTYDGLIYNEDTDEILECNLPAGEYYLRMGFKHSLTYSISIYFNDELLIEDMVLYAQGSNYHFDRGAASEVALNGVGEMYPEDFDVDYWQTIDEKAIAYDTDGYPVATITLEESGNFTITIDSYDIAYLYPECGYDNTEDGRNKSNVAQLMMYHWCLRPTYNNY